MVSWYHQRFGLHLPYPGYGASTCGTGNTGSATLPRDRWPGNSNEVTDQIIKRGTSSVPPPSTSATVKHCRHLAPLAASASGFRRVAGARHPGRSSPARWGARENRQVQLELLFQHAASGGRRSAPPGAGTAEAARRTNGRPRVDDDGIRLAGLNLLRVCRCTQLNCAGVLHWTTGRGRVQAVLRRASDFLTGNGRINIFTFQTNKPSAGLRRQA